MIQEEKKALRKEIRQLKKAISFNEKKSRSIIVLNQLEKLQEFRHSDVVMVYWSMKDEVHTHDFVRKWAQDKKIILPAVKGDELELRIFEGTDSMQAGESYGIPEPMGIPFTSVNDIGLIIVPGVAFDKKCQRMGRGKAFYDKLLKTTRAVKAGVCFDFQLFDIVPTDEHDIRMDTVITESAVINRED